MKSEGEGSTDPLGRVTATSVASISRVVSIAAVDTEAIVGVSSVSSISAVAKGQALKGQETASAKAKCKPKKPRKPQELGPKEAMLAYRLNLKKKLLETSVADLKVKEFENTNLKELIARLQKEQAEMIKTVMAMKEDERNVLSTESVYTRDQVTRFKKQNWSKEKRHTETLQKLTKSIVETDRDIETKKHGIESWKHYRDQGHLQHKQEISLLQKELNKMEKYFEQMQAQLEQDRFRSREESERVTEEIIEQNQCMATEKAITKMDRYDRKEIMENYWLQEEIKTQRHGIENLLHEIEELTQINLTLLNDAKHRHLEDLKISRITEQFSSAENLCENSTMETDLAKTSPKKSVVFNDENEAASSTATSPDKSAEVNVSKQEGKNVEDEDGRRCEAEDEKDDKYSKKGALELQFPKVSGRRHLNIKQSKTPDAEEVKALDNSSEQWPVTWNMLKGFCKNSNRH